MRRRKDYHRKRLSNPYFPAKKSHHRLRWLFFSVALAIIGIIFLANWDRLTIRQIIVNGNKFTATVDIESTVNQQLARRRWFIFSQQNTLFVDTRGLRSILKDTYQLATVDISRKNFDSLIITITEHEPVASVITNGRRYHINNGGVVIRELTGLTPVAETTANGTAVIRAASDSFDIPEIVGQANASAVSVGQLLISESLTTFIVSFHRELKNKADFEIVRYILGAPGSSDIVMMTSDGWEARLNSAEKPISQVESLLAVLQNKVIDRGKLKYIDVRFGDKVFYQ